MPAALLRATGIPIAGCRVTRPHVMARGATQLNQSAVLLHTTAHAAAAVMLWLLWWGERSYIIMILTRVPVVLEKSLNITEVILRNYGRHSALSVPRRCG